MVTSWGAAIKEGHEITFWKYFTGGGEFCLLNVLLIGSTGYFLDQDIKMDLLLVMLLIYTADKWIYWTMDIWIDYLKDLFLYLERLSLYI